MENYLDSFQGNILDPIHGVIKISEIEKWFIFQKPFNRLKRIKQNTFLYYVFPSANHTRFEHSIGVMHLASEIFEYLCKNYTSYFLKTQKYDVNDPKEFRVLDVKNVLQKSGQLEARYQELRLAALLHDVGHGPMSHKFDDFTITKNELLQIVKSEPAI
jgi:HD superfamily phosphohydrolase